MNYKKIYDKIIDNRKLNPLNEEIYGEIHHIKPRSLGGNDFNENLIKLTAREHFICHYLLSEMFEKETDEWYKMNHAFMMMKLSSKMQDRYLNNRLYEHKKIDFSKTMKKSQSGDKNSQFGKIWIYNESLKKTIKINNNELNDYKNLNWLPGRKINWDKTKCICCNNLFEKIGNEKICSSNCKKIYLKKIKEPTKIIKKIEKISKNYKIIFGSISKNKDFIISCMKNKCSKNQICVFLKVNNSGGSYETINNIYSRSLVEEHLTTDEEVVVSNTTENS